MAGLLALAQCGCSYALLETARTERPGTAGGSWGGSWVSNELSGEEGREGLGMVGLQTTVRVGVTDHADVGVGTFHGAGAQANVKYNLMGRRDALAVAPRLGVGWADEYEVFSAYGGLLGSYLLFPGIEPYAGVTFANYWIGDYTDPDSVFVDPGERLAERTGTGDGLLQMVIGLQIPADTGIAFLAEYGHWFVMQNDPGDFYKFIATDILSLGMRFGRAGPSRDAFAKGRGRAKPPPEPRRPRAPSAPRPAPDSGAVVPSRPAPAEAGPLPAPPTAPPEPPPAPPGSEDESAPLPSAPDSPAAEPWTEPVDTPDAGTAPGSPLPE